MQERNENVSLNARPYLSIKDKFCILQKKAQNMKDGVKESLKEADQISNDVTELVNIIDSTPSIFYRNSLDEIKNKEDLINKNTIHQNNENSR
jgi:hypothetical protein